MKRVQALLLLILVLTLTACGVSQTPPQAGSPSAQASTTASEQSTERIENRDSSLLDAGGNKDDALINMSIEDIPAGRQRSTPVKSSALIMVPLWRTSMPTSMSPTDMTETGSTISCI